MYNFDQSAHISQLEQDESLARKYTGGGIALAIDQFNRSKVRYPQPPAPLAINNEPIVVSAAAPTSIDSTNILNNQISVQSANSIEKPREEHQTISAPVYNHSTFYKPAQIKPVNNSDINVVANVQQHLNNPEALLNYIKTLKP